MKDIPDYIIDLGPENGHKGGEVLAHGTAALLSSVSLFTISNPNKKRNSSEIWNFPLQN